MPGIPRVLAMKTEDSAKKRRPERGKSRKYGAERGSDHHDPEFLLREKSQIEKDKGERSPQRKGMCQLGE